MEMEGVIDGVTDTDARLAEALTLALTLTVSEMDTVGLIDGVAGVDA